MKRIFATLQTDVRLQQRNGFYYAAIFVLGIYAVALTQLPLPGARLAWLLPAMAVNNLLITSFYFAGGMVLLERSDGTIAAQVVTPLRTREYVASKGLTLALLGTCYNSIIAALIAGPRVALALVPGLFAAALLYALFGLVAVARYHSLNTYLLPSLLYVSVLAAPMLPYTLGWDHWLFYLHPIQAPFTLMRAAIEAVPGWQQLVSLILTLLAGALTFRLACRSLERVRSAA
jgi:fluoroquinolone transport system permease protein